MAGTVAVALVLLDVVAAPKVVANATLSPVRHLVARTNGDQAIVTWQPPASGRAVRYQVQAILDNADYGTRVVRSTRIVWDRMPFNRAARFVVIPIGPDQPGFASGTPGPANTTGVVKAGNAYCAGPGECVVVDATEQQGPETLPGSGLLHGTLPAGNPYAKMLRLRSWRISANDPAEFGQAVSYVPSGDIIEVLSDGWYSVTREWLGAWYAADPWTSWSRYYAFVQADVRAALKRGVHPVWEIQNEPENYPYSPYQAPTRALVEQEYLVGYQAIKSVDPRARVIGPSIDWMYESAAQGWWIDMKSFIAFAAANRMKLAAIAWHDNGAPSDPSNYLDTPESVRDHAAEIRELIAENPGIGHPLLYVDENSSNAGQFAPGWAAGYLAEENRAGVNSADRACWGYPGQAAGSGCFQPNLDQLLDKDGVPLPSFWTLVDYASMSGTQVWSQSTDTHLSSLAVANRTGQVRLLLGRHQTCSGWTAGSEACPQTRPPAAVNTTVNVLLPMSATAARVTIQTIPDVYSGMAKAPATRSMTVQVVHGLARVTLRSVADGSAYFLTITPNRPTGPGPGNGNLMRDQSPPATGQSTPTRLLAEGNANNALVLRSYSQPLTALATDQYGDPLAGRKVVFQVPASYATFQGGSSTAVVTTNAYGLATSPMVRAGGRPGDFSATAYMVQAGRWGRPYARFVLTNYV